MIENDTTDATTALLQMAERAFADRDKYMRVLDAYRRADEIEDSQQYADALNEANELMRAVYAAKAG